MCDQPRLIRFFVLALTLLEPDPGVISTSTGDAAIRMFHTNILLANKTMSKINTPFPTPLLPTVHRPTATQQVQPQALKQGLGSGLVLGCRRLVNPHVNGDGDFASNELPNMGNKPVAPPPPPRRPVSTAQKNRGKEPPQAFELYRTYPQNVMQYYQTEGDFSNVIFFLVKGQWLGEQDLYSVAMMHNDFKDMIDSVPALLDLDFSSLREPVLDYASQTEVSPDRVRLMTACAVYYNLDIGLVVRYLGREYTASWQNIPDILAAADPYISDEVHNQLHRY